MSVVREHLAPKRLITTQKGFPGITGLKEDGATDNGRDSQREEGVGRVGGRVVRGGGEWWGRTVERGLLTLI